MISSEPPLSHSGNSTQLLDDRRPVLGVQPLAPIPDLRMGTSGIGPILQPTSDPLSLISEHSQDNINNMHNLRNKRRADHKTNEGQVLEDEMILMTEDYIAMASVMGQPLQLLVRMPMRSPMIPPHQSDSIPAGDTEKVCFHKQGHAE